MQSPWRRSRPLGGTAINGISSSISDNDSELPRGLFRSKSANVSRSRSFRPSRETYASARIIKSRPENSNDEIPTIEPTSLPPVALEGTLEFRKSHTSNDAKSWRRGYVVFDMRNGGSISCYKQMSGSKAPSRLSHNVSQCEDMAPRIHLPAHANWIVKDIQHNSTGFIIEIPSSEPLLPLLNNDSAGDGEDEDEDRIFQVKLHEQRPMREKRPMNEIAPILPSDLNDDLDRAKIKGQPLRIYFRCCRSNNEKILWLQAFEQTQRLSLDLHRQRGLRNIFGNPNLKISHSRSRSHMAHLFAKEGKVLQTSHQLDDDNSVRSIHDDPGIRLRERVKGNGSNVKEYLVYPLNAYPNRWMTDDELYSEVVKPSDTFHDLRRPNTPKQEIGTLRVEVLQCLGLPALDFAPETDAVAYFVCGSYAFTSDVIWNKLNPMWLPRSRRACIFPLFHAYARLFVGIFDDDGKGEKDDFAGRVIIDLARCRPRSTYDVTLPLRLSSHVYSRRPRGSVRLRFSIEYHSERDAILSYIPASLELPSGSRPDNDVTVICADEKAFRNVVTTVHGIHMPGRFSFVELRATMREAHFARKVATNVMVSLIMDLVQWRMPAFSFLIFCAWMHAVYQNLFSLVPLYLVLFLLLMMIQTYTFYGSDGPIQNGFIPPSWEELFVSLVKGGTRIEPLATNVKTPSRRPSRLQFPLVRNRRVMVEACTHQQRGNWLFQLLGFSKTLPKDKSDPEDYHMEFPYSRGVRNPTTQKAQYPKFTVTESLVSKSKNKWTTMEDEGENLFADMGLSSMSMSRERRRTWDVFSKDRKVVRRKLSMTSSASPIQRDGSDQSLLVDPKDDEVDIPARLLFPDQNADAKGPTRKKKLGNELAELRENLHKVTLHLFNDRTHRIRRKDACYFGSAHGGRTAHLDHDLERLLNIGQYSSANPLVPRVGIYIGPLIGAAQSALCLTRVVYNIVTWRDPILSFWVSLILIAGVIILAIFPWRLFFLVMGCLVIGPQNYCLRVMDEKGTTPHFIQDFRKKRKMAKAAKIAGMKSSDDVPRDQPIISSHTTDNTPPVEVTFDDVDPREVHEVCVPYSQLMYHRMYDWPPEPTFSRCEPTASFERDAQRLQRHGGRNYSSDLILSERSPSPSEGMSLRFDASSRAYHY